MLNICLYGWVRGNIFDKLPRILTGFIISWNSFISTAELIKIKMISGHNHHHLPDQLRSSPLAIERIAVGGSFRRNPPGQSTIGNFLFQEFDFYRTKNSLLLGSLEMFATYSKGDDFHDSLLSAEVNFDFFYQKLSLPIVWVLVAPNSIFNTDIFIFQILKKIWVVCAPKEIGYPWGNKGPLLSAKVRYLIQQTYNKNTQ